MQLHGLTGITKVAVVFDAVFVPKLPLAKGIVRPYVTDPNHHRNRSPIDQADSGTVVLNTFDGVRDVSQTVAGIPDREAHDDVRDVRAERAGKTSHGAD